MQTSDAFVCRGVIHELDFDEAAKLIFGSAQKADEVLGGIVFALAREPHTHASVAGQFGTLKVYTLKTLGSLVWPAVTIYYTCDDTNVRLLAIERSDEDDED